MSIFAFWDLVVIDANFALLFVNWLVWCSVDLWPLLLFLIESSLDGFDAELMNSRDTLWLDQSWQGSGLVARVAPSWNSESYSLVIAAQELQ